MTDLARYLSALMLLALAGLLGGCGQTGQLYLPEPAGGVVTSPTQKPPPEPGDSSNSPKTVDSPDTPDTPAPEVTEPEKKKDDPKSPPPTPPSKPQ